MSFAQLPAEEKLLQVRGALTALLGEEPSPRDILHLAMAAQLVLDSLEESVEWYVVLLSWQSSGRKVDAA